ncbi:MAG TPA: glycosyltransferase [Allosphingosinicella sp.]|nr:glycosyltransferase [Allosphingosinicella sp.]
MADMLRGRRSARPIQLAVLVSRFPELSQTFVLDQVAALIDAGFDVTVFAGRRARGGLRHATGRALAGHGRYADRALLPRLLNLPGFSAGLRRRAHERALRRLHRQAAAGFDLLLCHFGPVGLQAVAASRGLARAAPIWTIFHGYDVSRFIVEQGEDAYAHLFRHGDRFLPISRLWQRRLAGLGCPEDRIGLLRMGVDCERIEFAPRPRADGPLRILTVGRLVEKKGTAFALAALAHLQQAAPELRWVFEVAGDGPLEQPLRQAAGELGLGERVSFLGALSSSEVQARLRQADIFLLPSIVAADGDMEGIPVALMEAMAAGVPVVSTFHSGIPELVEHGVSGLLAPERDPAALAEQLRTLIESPSTSHSLALAARAKIEAEFNQRRINAGLAESIAERVAGKAALD